MRLKGKIALITGAARGIGLATAALFVREGAFVILSDIRDEAGKAAAEKFGENARYLHLDVGNENDWMKAAAEIMQSSGRLDILINNAGITGFLESAGPWDVENCDLKSWEEVHRVNATGVMLGCKYAIRLMKARGGSIVNISSRSGIVGIPGAAAYASSKASVRNHTKSVALYCAEQGMKIRCNSIHPAAIMTPMWDAMLGEGERRQSMIDEIEAGIPLGHFGEPADVAYAVLYLASDESNYVTGIELTIDGGILAGSEGKPKVSSDKN